MIRKYPSMDANINLKNSFIVMEINIVAILIKAGDFL